MFMAYEVGLYRGAWIELMNYREPGLSQTPLGMGWGGRVVGLAETHVTCITNHSRAGESTYFGQ